jgi:hypothetical protein
MPMAFLTLYLLLTAFVKGLSEGLEDVLDCSPQFEPVFEARTTGRRKRPTEEVVSLQIMLLIIGGIMSAIVLIMYVLHVPLSAFPG